MVSTKCNGMIKAIVAPMDLAQPALCHKIKETICIENYGSTIEMLLIRMTSSADCRGANCCRIKNPISKGMPAVCGILFETISLCV